MLAPEPPGSLMGGQDQSSIGWDHSRRPAGPGQSKARVTDTRGLWAAAGMPGDRPEGAQTHQRTMFSSHETQAHPHIHADPLAQAGHAVCAHLGGV